MSRRLTSCLVACAVVVATLLAPQSTSADFTDGVRQFFGRADQTPHPSVVQVLAPEPGALSRGSGTLIHVDGQFGYVITNWHVVRDAPGDVIVIFPDGHQSLARILKTDDVWDLALLLIWRGASPPMTLSAVVPQAGEPLTIAGYGGEGKFRAARGVFTTYAAPEPDMPYEMFEVSVAARQGDSGGPIVNQRGELAGVLFGAGDGRTTGTQVHRVRDFVNEALRELRDKADAVAQSHVDPPIVNRPGIQHPPQTASLSNQEPMAQEDQGFTSESQVPQEYIPRGALPASPLLTSEPVGTPLPIPSPTRMRESPREPTPKWEARPSDPPQFANGSFPEQDQSPAVEFGGALQRPAPVSIQRQDEPSVVNALPVPVVDQPRRPRVPAGGVTWDQLKSFFAAVGVFAVLNTVTQLLFVSKRRK